MTVRACFFYKTGIWCCDESFTCFFSGEESVLGPLDRVCMTVPRRHHSGLDTQTTMWISQNETCAYKDSSGVVYGPLDACQCSSSVCELAGDTRLSTWRV